MQQEEGALMKASFCQREDWPTGRLQAGCVGNGLYDVQPGGSMQGSDIMYLQSVCVSARVCVWRM